MLAKFPVWGFYIFIVAPMSMQHVAPAWQKNFKIGYE